MQHLLMNTCIQATLHQLRLSAAMHKAYRTMLAVLLVHVGPLHMLLRPSVRSGLVVVS